MSENNTIQIKKDLQQITDMLLLNGTLTECPGLVHGKMGIAIFFFHYAQYTNNMLFADYAMRKPMGESNRIILDKRFRIVRFRPFTK